ncbi:MAG: phenylalanine--tRNA ligase subunit beta [Bacteroidales bacterium]|nr:phenylalanine--tRNA ligase subunit beta [Bacteroidales bacterium]MCB9013650.1 phenylalanine--tRNA ligase subunit beta [Bacteroidales bacterium]
MKISYNWLKQYIRPLPSPEETSKILTSIGLEVESIEERESVKGGLKGVLVAEVLSCIKHPNADKLSVTTVNFGKGEPVQIVCGAPNVRAGQKVAVATVGTTLYSGDESFTINKSKIRGEVSEGMICAEDELGLGKDHDGIMVLDSQAVPGTPASEYFKIESDFILEIGLTPNRIDAASHYGVARDLAAYLKQTSKAELLKPDVSGFATDNKSLTIPVEVSRPEACIRYSGLTLSGIKVKPSPDWLKNRLLSIGLKPINNVVDITNFVLHETGQPLHAFDAEKITGKKILVKTLPEGTPFTTLDESERKLSQDDLMICNTNEGMCIAGVFGGLESGVNEKTTSIFLESACFNPVFVRKTSKRHMLNTDSSFRFERGSDPNITLFALKRAALLIKEFAGGSISSEVVDIYPAPVQSFEIELNFKHVNRLIGKEIPREKVTGILKSLEIEITEENEETLKLKVPPYRVDVQREADVIEEILRIYGYNNIEIGESLHGALSFIQKPDREKIVNMVSDLLSNNGFLEIMSNSLTRSSYYENESGEDKELVRISNPLSNDLNVMRKNLLFGALESLAYNINRKNPDLRLYEFGNTYLLTGKVSENPHDKYFEESHLALLISGEKYEANWNSPSASGNFFQIKSFAELILKRLGFSIDAIGTMTTSGDFFAEGIDYTLNQKVLLSVGKLKNDLCRRFEIKQDVFYADFNWDRVMKEIKKHKTIFTGLPKYPEVKRDLSMVLEKTVSYDQIRQAAYKAERKLLRNINLFDVYEGDKIAEGKKSYAISFTLRDDEKTLTDQQIEKVMKNIQGMIERETGAHIRS